jgi:hypothetical protein
MTESKYGKYIITESIPHMFNAPGEDTKANRQRLDVVNLNDDIIPGAPLVECSWKMPADLLLEQKTIEPHCHDFDEILMTIGSDPNNRHDLGAETIFWLGDEKLIINKSHIMYIPKGLVHGPGTFPRIDRPIIHIAFAVGKKYK